MSTSSHSRVKTERTRPPRTTTSAGSSPRATARRRARSSMQEEATTLRAVDVLTPRSLDEALRLKAEVPDAVPIQGGTDVMVELNFDRSRPPALLNLNEVADLRGWSRAGERIVLGAGLTYTEAMQTPLPALAEASRTVGGPQIRNRGTIGGNLGTSSPAGDALPPLLVAGAQVRMASVRGERTTSLQEFVVGVKRNALADDELIVDVSVDAGPARETFMKVETKKKKERCDVFS